MRYDPNGYAPYPILRPHSSDYPDGSFDTKFTHEVSDDAIKLAVEFLIDEPMIMRQIEKGAAKCCFLLYCSGTFYSEMLQAPSGSLEIVESIPRRLLTGSVEAHPSILTADPVALDTETAHSDYAGQFIAVDKYHQLAVAPSWEFNVQIRPSFESVFQIQRISNDAELADGQFEFRAEVEDRYVVIRANSTTYDTIQSMRNSHLDPLVLSTVYLSALNAALTALDPESADENEHSNGWASALRLLMRENNIETDAIYSGIAAQQLLGNPLSYLRTAALQEELI